MKKSLAVAVSGGADSLLAAIKAARDGYAVHALHAHFLPPGGNEPVLARLGETLARFNIPLSRLDLSREFDERVIKPFVAAYAAGETPNPCAVCNPAMKFGLLMEAALGLGEQGGLGLEYFATGHYARIVDHPTYGRTIAAGADPEKEQSYFLCLVPRERLDRVVLPLGEMRKSDVLAELTALGAPPPLARESQEVCFVPDDDYRAFLAARGADLSGPGPIVLAGGREVGRHQGLWRYTLGQRRGLGVAHSEPLYVLAKESGTNSLIVGVREELGVRETTAGELNILVEPSLWPGTVMVKVRYRMAPRPASWSLESGRVGLAFHDPVSRPAAGQVAALYDSQGVLLAGGVITADPPLAKES